MNKEASNEKIAERLVKLRKDNNLTQDEVANSLGIAKSSLANYESGYRAPNYEILKKIANILCCTVEYLIMGEDEEPDLDIISKIDKIMSGESEERKNLVKAIVDFSDEDILLLDKIIKGFGNKKTD